MHSPMTNRDFSSLVLIVDGYRSGVLSSFACHLNRPNGGLPQRVGRLVSGCLVNQFFLDAVQYAYAYCTGDVTVRL